MNINSGGSATLNAGIYSFNGAVNVNAFASLSGTGVTLYFKSGALTLNSGAYANLSAPTSGTDEGIVIFQDRANSASMIINSWAMATLTGAIYLPAGTLIMNSGGFANTYSVVVADKIIVNSGAVLNLNSDYSSLADASPIKHSVIVE